MYEAYYGLREKPFSILPDPDLIYWGDTHRLAFAMLEFGVMNSAGFTVITGEIGCGKTTLVRYLLRQLNRHIALGLISNTPEGKADLLQWVMMSLKSTPRRVLSDVIQGISALPPRTVFERQTNHTDR